MGRACNSSGRRETGVEFWWKNQERKKQLGRPRRMCENNKDGYQINSMGWYRLG
jgi:hypothetical protein